MKIIFSLIHIISILHLTRCQNIQVDTDYSPLNKAFESVQSIQMKYDRYKQIIYKNVSIEYSKCENFITQLKCNNLNQWQSVIEELQLENNNSQLIEVPYLIERKKMKVNNFSQLLNQTENENQIYQNYSHRLLLNQQAILDAFYFIEEMYKLPNDLVQIKQNSTLSASQVLNSDIPDIAKEELDKARTEYDIADESIQAQTTANLLRTFNNKMIETMKHFKGIYDNRIQSMNSKKELLQGDILKTRIMIKNEIDKQMKNNQRINQLEQQIQQCEDKPIDILKDCTPIRVNASKLLTEIEIIQTRTNLLNDHISSTIEDNLSEDQVNNYLQGIKQKQSQKEKQAVIDFYLRDQEYQYFEERKPNELQPIHHLKDNLKQEENQQTENA